MGFLPSGGPEAGGFDFIDLALITHNSNEWVEIDTAVYRKGKLSRVKRFEHATIAA